jgi:signal transduction histidine kinase/Tfp pilus assembly protein PilF
MKKPLLLLLLFCFQWTLFAQQETDSLCRIVKTAKNDSVRVKALNKLAFLNIFSDSQKALLLLKQSENVSKSKTNCRYGYAEMLNFKGALMDVMGKPDSAYHYLNRSIRLSRQYRFANLEVRSMNNLGMVNWSNGNFREALHLFLESLRINETLPPDQQMKFDTSYSNIGLVYQELSLDEKALEYHQKAYAIRKAKGMLKEQAISLNNIGICYNAMNQTAKAVEIYKQGLVIAKASGNDVDYCKLLENLGNAYQSQYKYREAIKCYEEELTFAVAIPKMKIGAYSSLAAAYNKLGQPQMGIRYGEMGIALLKANPGIESFASHLYQYTAQSYYMVGNIDKGEAYNREFLGITKQIFSDENATQMAGYEIKYETAKKEKQLAQNKAKLLESEARARQKNMLVIGLLVLAFFLVVTGLLVFRQQKLKSKQLEQEHKLKETIAQIETQNQLQEQRLSISRDLHDNIGAQLTFIISSVENIKYAFDIANPKLDDRLQNISSFAQSTILELRDTIWAMNSSKIVFEDLKARILNFIEKAKTAREKIDFHFMIDPKLATLQLSSIAGMNLYRTIQEAVNNAVKYSEADTIEITAESIGDEMKIVVRDNGIGFDKQTTERGNGLANMEKRIEDIGGILSLHSEKQKGTTITVLVNKNETV